MSSRDGRPRSLGEEGAKGSAGQHALSIEPTYIFNVESGQDGPRRRAAHGDLLRRWPAARSGLLGEPAPRAHGDLRLHGRACPGNRPREGKRARQLPPRRELGPSLFKDVLIGVLRGDGADHGSGGLAGLHIAGLPRVSLATLVISSDSGTRCGDPAGWSGPAVGGTRPGENPVRPGAAGCAVVSRRRCGPRAGRWWGSAWGWPSRPGKSKCSASSCRCSSRARRTCGSSWIPLALGCFFDGRRGRRWSRGRCCWSWRRSAGARGPRRAGGVFRAAPSALRAQTRRDRRARGQADENPGSAARGDEASRLARTSR